MKKTNFIRLLVLMMVLITSINTAWATFSSDGSAYFYFHKNQYEGGNKFDFSGSGAVLWLNMWDGTGGTRYYEASHIAGDWYGAKITDSGTFAKVIIIRKDPNNSHAHEGNYDGKWNQSNEISLGDNINCLNDGGSQGVYRPNVNSFTLTPSSFYNLGGAGTSENPYKIPAGSSVTFTVSNVDRDADDDENMDLYCEFNENNTTPSKQKGTTPSYTYTATTDPNTNFNMMVYVYNRYQNGDGNNSNRQIFFKTVQYYVAGNGNGKVGWCDGVDWDENESPMTYDATNTDWYITFDNVGVSDELQFAITDGTWSNTWRHGEYNSSCATNVTETGVADAYSNTNCNLAISDPSNITIRFNPNASSGSKICASAVGLYNGLAVAISDANAASTPTISASYTTSDEPVTITAYAANTGYTWAGWTANGGSITSSSSLITTWSPGASNKTATANYTEHISTITINTPSATEGSLNTTGSKSLGKTTTLALTATPADGYVFDHWTTSGVARLTTSTTTNPTTVTTDGTNGGTGSVTAVFKPRYVLRGSLYGSDTEEGMPGWGTNDFGFAYANSEWSVTTNSLTKSTKYKFKIYDREESTYLGIDAETEYTNGAKGSKAFSSSNDKHGWFNSTFAGPYKFVLDKTNMKITITFNSKTLPDYSGKSVTQALNSAASGYVIGSGTSVDHYKVYASTASDHGKVDLTMNYSGVSTAHDGIWYSVGGDEVGAMTDDVENSKATVTMSMSTSANSYSPTIKAYGKVDDQYNLSYAASLANLYYDVVATPTLAIALKTTSDVAITSTTGLEVGQSIKIVPTLSGAIRDGSYVTYSYRISGTDDEWTTIASTQATNSDYTWSSSLPTEPNIYTIKATYTDLGVSVEATQDIVYWKDYTIYVWETGQNLATANQNITRVHEYYKANSTDSGDPVRTEHTWTTEGVDPLKTTTDLSDTWGGGWCSFNLKWPLYNYFIVGYEAYNDNQYQSNYYYLATKPEDLYLQCNYSGSSKWTWGASSIEEPQMPSITITSVNIYATKMVIDVAYDNHYSLLTASSLTVDGVAKDISGSVTNVGGGTYRCTLTNLDENTDYTFRASATNALGTATETSVITTLAKMPITMTIKVSSNLMANAANMWGNNGKTTVKIKYWNDNANFDGIAELDQIRTSGGYAWYKYTIEDSPVNFYIFNANYADGSGSDRSANWNNQSSDGCAEVYDDVTQDAYKNHVIGSPAMCGVHYKLAYYNGSTTIESNAIGDASDKMSLYINAYNGGSPAGRSLKLYKFDADWDSGTEIFSTVNPTESAVYVVSLKEGEDFETATSASKWDFEKYTGNYYIRTDHAPGGRNNYRGNSNKMTYSDYAANATGSTFDHYFCKWVQGASDDQRNVSFTIANDYCDNLLGGSNMYVSDDYATGYGYLKQNASVRFMYDSRRNDLSRAYLSGSSRESDYFLVLRGDHSSSNHLWKDAEKTNEHTTNGTTDWAFFKDNNNWVYQVDVYAVPGTRIKLTARMKDKNNANKDQSFKGDASNDSFGEDYTDLLIGGTTSETAYPMRIIYDFKTNRLMTAWLPSELSTDLGINADVMLIRNGQGDAQHITLNNHQLTDVHTVYAVMQFNRWRLNNRANPELMTVASCAREDGTDNWVYDETVTNSNHPAIAEGASGWLSRYERDLYWISFPFDVNLNEVFGSVGTYGTHWIIEYYDGKGRAKNGFWADSPSNWKFINNVNTTLKANVGYILALDLDYFAYNNTTTWANNIHQVELYFPSMVSVETIKQDDVVVHIDTVGYQCTINRGTADGDRRIKDSHWHCIGVPSFANTTHGTNTGWTTDEGTKDDEVDAGDYPSRTDWTSPDLPYLYEWVPSDNSLKPVNSSSTTFEAMYSYLVQYNKDTIKWMQVAAPSVSAPASIAARQLDTDMRDFEYCLKLNKDSIIQDQTFVRFTDNANVTTAFEFNHDLSKEMNKNRGNIWTVTSDGTPVAGNSQPHPLTTTIVPVGVKIAANGEYTFSMPEGTNGGDVWLIDNANSSRTNLGLMDYTVNLTTGTYEGRFSLEFPVQNVVTEIENAANANANANANADAVRKVFVGGQLYIIRDGVIYNASGARVQ